MWGMVVGYAQAATFEVNPGDDVEAAIAALAPGDELVVHGGEYPLTDRFSVDLVGTEAEPIVVRAADGEVPHFHRPNADQNIWDVDRAEHVVLRGLEWSGGSAGVRLSAAVDLTIEDGLIHDTADVALRANDVGVTYEGLHIVHNEIRDTSGTGEGMYLGCNDDGCRLANSVIERNWVHHTNGPGVEQGDGIELKEGSHDVVIRDNVVHDTHYPCIITYSTNGNGGPNVIERNVMWGCGDHGIQSAADATIRNNLILGSASDGIAMQPHQSGSPSNLYVVHNTVLHATNDAISLRGVVGAVTIADNALYAQVGTALNVVDGDLSALSVSGNVGVGGSTAGGLVDGDLAADFVDAHYGNAPPIDLFPVAGSALLDVGGAPLALDDFNGTPRTTADAGAYQFDPDGNPGWTVTAGFKELAAPGTTDPSTSPTEPSTSPTDPSASDPVGPGASEPGGCGCDGGPGGGILASLAALLLLRRRVRG